MSDAAIIEQPEGSPGAVADAGSSLQRVAGGFERGGGIVPKADVGLASRGLRPAVGTRVRPAGVPDGWRIRGTSSPGGTWYYDPTNKGNAVRAMQGNPKSPFPNSQAPYVRWQRNGQPLDAQGNALPSKNVPEAHIPLAEFRFRPGAAE